MFSNVTSFKIRNIILNGEKIKKNNHRKIITNLYPITWKNISKSEIMTNSMIDLISQFHDIFMLKGI